MWGDNTKATPPVTDNYRTNIDKIDWSNTPKKDKEKCKKKKSKKS